MNIPVRYFAYAECEEFGIDIVEVDETDFIEASKKYGCLYERNTVFQNGVSQICLTANNQHDPIEN